MKLKLVSVLLLTGVLGGCAATITPRGDIYAEALFPAVVIDTPVFVPEYRPAPRPMGPIVSGRRYPGPSRPQGHFRPGPGPRRR